MAIDLIISTQKDHLPQGQAGNFTGNAKIIIETACIALDRIKIFLDNVLNESDPLTAELMINEWLDSLGIKAADDATIWGKRSLASSIYTSIGGQSLGYIQDAIQKAFPDVYIEEIEESGEKIASYIILGFYPFSSNRVQIESILTRLAPLHCVPVFNARPVYDGDVARCGLGLVGRAIVRRSETLYNQTNGEIGICSIGRIGLMIVGRTE